MGSDELRDSIIKDFDLYKHYGINQNDPFAHEKVLLALNSQISIRRELTSSSLLHLSVEDDDRFVAAGIANRMVERVNLMNKEILAKDLQKRVTKYESLLPSLKDKATDSRNQFVGFVDSITPSLSKDKEDLPIRYRMIASDLVGKMDKNTNKYDDMLAQYYDLMGTAKTIGNDEWQCVTIIKKAMPDIKSWNNTVMQYSVGLSFIALLTYISGLVFLYQNEDKMHLLHLAIKGKQKTK